MSGETCHGHQRTGVRHIQHAGVSDARTARRAWVLGERWVLQCTEAPLGVTRRTHRSMGLAAARSRCLGRLPPRLHAQSHCMRMSSCRKGTRKTPKGRMPFCRRAVKNKKVPVRSMWVAAQSGWGTRGELPRWHGWRGRVRQLGLQQLPDCNTPCLLPRRALCVLHRTRVLVIRCLHCDILGPSWALTTVHANCLCL